MRFSKQIVTRLRLPQKIICNQLWHFFGTVVNVLPELSEVIPIGFGLRVLDSLMFSIMNESSKIFEQTRFAELRTYFLFALFV